MFEVQLQAASVTLVSINFNNELVKKVREAYEKYEFHIAFRELLGFCSLELSMLYFDILKDRLYTFPPKSKARRSAQTAMYWTLEILVRAFAPRPWCICAD